MNRAHLWYCRRESWLRHVRDDLVPAATDGADLGGEVLEVGPGFGPATEVLERRAAHVTAIELDAALAERLRGRLGPRVDVVHGDATAMPFRDASFSGAASFTMLHHVPSPVLQDRVFAEVHRVLAPGGTFVGTDSTGGSLRFRLLHVADTCVLLDPETLGDRLRAAGFATAAVDTAAQPSSVVFHATKA